MARFRGVAVGCGYFSGFQYEAWSRIPEVEMVALCNRDMERAQPLMTKHGIRTHYSDYKEMLENERPDFVDIITPPESHLEICRVASSLGIAIICQKPLAPTLEQAREIVRVTDEAGTRFMVHENFRFQPWHREIKRLIAEGAIGGKLFSLTFRTRQGDGWGEDAYLGRQPYFREYPRLLIYETGVHIIDTFRFLAGEVRSVYCVLRKLNPVIAGEDCGLLVFQFSNGAVGTWDANRYNGPNYEDPRYTFGEFLVEGDEGSIRLYPDGRLTLQRLGEPETEHPYRHEKVNFAGDCCYATQRHFIDRLIDGGPFETNGAEYLKTLTVQEAFYKSARENRVVTID